MSNWFQNHPATSIITYTLVVIGATWATSTFILQDNRLNLAKSELESQKTSAEQYRSKSDLLQKDIEALRSENLEYRNWLAQSKDAVPIMVPQLVELKKEVARLHAQSTMEAQKKAQAPQQNSPASTTPTSTEKTAPKPLPQAFAQTRTVTLGSAGIDETTGAVVTVKRTNPDRTATLILAFPDRTQVLEVDAYAGKQFKFIFGGRTFLLTILEITFYSDTVRYRLQPIAA